MKKFKQNRRLVENRLIHFTSERKLAGMMNVVINLSLFAIKKSFAVHITAGSEVEFVHAVSAGGSVKFLPAEYISPFSLIFCVFFPLKLLK